MMCNLNTSLVFECFFFWFVSWVNIFQPTLLKSSVNWCDKSFWSTRVNFFLNERRSPWFVYTVRKSKIKDFLIEKVVGWTLGKELCRIFGYLARGKRKMLGCLWFWILEKSLFKNFTHIVGKLFQNSWFLMII